MKLKKMNKKGFSMLELVVVMLIMGTLAGIAISKMGGSDTGAVKAGMKSDLRGAIASVNACYADKLDYTDCDAAVYVGTGGTGTAVSNNNLVPAPATTDGNTITITTASAKNIFPTINVSNVTLTTVFFSYANSIQGIKEGTAAMAAE